MKISPDGKTVWVGTTMATYDGTAWKLLAKDNFPAPDYAQRPVLMAFDRNYQNEPGLLRYDGKSCKKFNLQNNHSTMMEIDAEGNKWIATHGGFVIVVREGGVNPSS